MKVQWQDTVQMVPRDGFERDVIGFFDLSICRETKSPKTPYPEQHQAIPVTGRGKALGSENVVLKINDRRDMQLPVSIGASDDVRGF